MQQRELKPEVVAYLDRIRYRGAVDVSGEVLGALQQAHLMAVPYENLDILQGIPLSLEVEALWDKIVRRRRGGYCFELNALFGWLLRELGYNVTDLVARFWRDAVDMPPKRRHHVLRVEAAGSVYLCDVGVGGVVPRRSLLIEEGLEQQQGEECYRLERDAELGWLLNERKKGEWGRVYSFTEERQLANDYAFANYWCQYAPESPFRTAAILSICTESGRNTGAGEEIRLFRAEDVTVLTPQTQEEYNEKLAAYFGITI